MYKTRNHLGTLAELSCFLFPSCAATILAFIFLLLHFSLLGRPFYPFPNIQTLPAQLSPPSQSNGHFKKQIITDC